jgi:hypothetical protein
MGGSLYRATEEHFNMSKMSKEEVEKRGRRMQQDAVRSVAKTEQLNLRMDEANIYRLYTLAKNKRKPVGTMVREWIVERLDLEESPHNQNAKFAAEIAEAVLKALSSRPRNTLISNLRKRA